MNAALIAACATASRRLNKPAEPLYFERYTPEPKPRYVGYISVRSNGMMDVAHSMSCDGVDIKFKSFTEVDDLIRKLVKLRDDMIEKEFGVSK